MLRAIVPESNDNSELRPFLVCIFSRLIKFTNVEIETPTLQITYEFCGYFQLKPEQIKLGNKLLVYISCCLAGRAYPYGDIDKDKVIILFRLRQNDQQTTFFPLINVAFHIRLVLSL